MLSKDQASVVLDCCDENECNWLCLVQAATNKEEQNCIAYQLGVNIFYNTTRLIRGGEKLKVWYASQYAKKLGKPVQPDGTTKGVCLTHLFQDGGIEFFSFISGSVGHGQGVKVVTFQS